MSNFIIILCRAKSGACPLYLLVTAAQRSNSNRVGVTNFGKKNSSHLWTNCSIQHTWMVYNKHPYDIVIHMMMLLCCYNVAIRHYYESHRIKFASCAPTLNDKEQFNQSFSEYRYNIIMMLF